MPLDVGTRLVEPGKPIEHLCFPEDGIVSVVDDLPQGGQTEIGIFGRDGMSGTSTLLGVDTSPHATFVQVEGKCALIIPARPLLDAVDTQPAMRRVFLRYVHTFNIQVALTAVSNAHHSLQQRLARWLLMCHDRLDGDEIPLTHEFIAMMIAVRRTGVTEALHVLEGLDLIRSRRSVVIILNRPGLERHAGEAYGKPEAEQRALSGGLGAGTNGAGTPHA